MNKWTLKMKLDAMLVITEVHSIRHTIRVLDHPLQSGCKIGSVV